MTLELSKQQQDLLHQVLDAGRFETPEQVLDYALTMALTESESFAKEARQMLLEAQEAKAEGRVTHIPHGNLLKVIKERQA